MQDVFCFFLQPWNTEVPWARGSNLSQSSDKAESLTARPPGTSNKMFFNEIMPESWLQAKMLLSLEGFRVRAPWALGPAGSWSPPPWVMISGPQEPTWGFPQGGGSDVLQNLAHESLVSMYSRNRYKEGWRYTGYGNNTYYEYPGTWSACVWKDRLDKMGNAILLRDWE